MGGEENRERWWSEREIDRMRKMLNNGFTVDEVAEKLGRTRKAVQIKLSKLGWNDLGDRSIPSAVDDANIFCPFFISMRDRKKISCEGLAKADKAILFFSVPDNWEEHIGLFCQTGNYENCPLAKALIEKNSE